MPLLRRSRPAMASLFELWLSGEDPEHLDAVTAVAMEEIVRVERLLSRFDPAAEIARVNREATDRPVVVNVELFEVLQDCLSWNLRTGGAFDPCVPSGRYADDVRLDEDRRAVRFTGQSTRIDLGGYGKGVAIDRVADRIASFGVQAMLHIGTSSARGVGSDPEGRPWMVALRDPFTGASPASSLDRFALSDRALSCSAVFEPGASRSDLLDPSTGRSLVRPSACAVIAATAAAAEALSTALLVVGRERARRMVAGREHLPDDIRVAWLEQVNGSISVEWWPTAPEPIR